MQIWNGLERLPPGSPPVVATIGNYDGCHVGHRAIFREATQDARRRGLTSLAITFEPHPLAVVAPERCPPRIHTRGQKIEALGSTGLDALLILEFNKSLATRTGREFLESLLLPSLPLAAIHVGRSFRFGRGREGTIDLLRTIGVERGFEVHAIEPIQVDGEVVSSSTIRAAILAGDVTRARGLLGQPFTLVGEVVSGAGRGRQLGFPSANIEVENQLLPSIGVYVTETCIGAEHHLSMSNLGVRPTFGETRIVVESHLIDFSGDLYRERVETRFLARLRDERRFSGPEELKAQLTLDRAEAVKRFSGSRAGIG